jgi:hypothetical protein
MGMFVEPDLGRGVLAAALNREYGLAAGAVRFIPVGETAWCYQVTDERGRRWFLKLGAINGVDFFRMQDGRQAEHWGGPDMFSFLVQGRVMPGPGTSGPGTPA